jgi:hypothetical protein
VELVEGSNLTRVFVQDTVLDFPRLNVITRDNASVYIDSVLSFKVVNPKLMLYSCVNLQAMLSKLLQVRRVLFTLHLHLAPCTLHLAPCTLHAPCTCTLHLHLHLAPAPCTCTLHLHL